MLETRLDLILKHEDPELEALAIYEQSAEDEERPDTIAGMLAEFLDRRDKSIALLEGLPLKDLWRTGRTWSLDGLKSSARWLPGLSRTDPPAGN